MSNIIKFDAATALKLAREAGNAEHGSHAKLAYAVEAVMQQAYEGNLDPAFVIASQWSDPARKAAAKLLKHFTGGDLKVKAASDKFKGASLAKGWSDRKVENFDFEGITAAILSTCPTNHKGEPVAHRASIYRAAKALDGSNPPATATLDTIQQRTVKAVVKLDLPGIDADLAERLIAEAFASMASVSKAYTAKQTTEASEAKAAAKATKGRVKRTRRTRKAA